MIQNQRFSLAERVTALSARSTKQLRNYSRQYHTLLREYFVAFLAVSKPTATPTHKIQTFSNNPEIENSLPNYIRKYK